MERGRYPPTLFLNLMNNMKEKLTYFIFGALTYQICFIVPKKMFLNEQKLTRKEVREKVSCYKSRVRKEFEDEKKIIKISDYFVDLEEKKFRKGKLEE